MTVTATIEGACSVSANPLAFGNYTVANSGGANLDGSTSISVTCTTGTGYGIGLDAGTGSGATETLRRMTLAAGSVTSDYALFQDSARSVVWGDTDGAGGNRKTGQVGTGAAQSHTVYGRIPGGQIGTPGNYADTVLVTVHY